MTCSGTVSTLDKKLQQAIEAACDVKTKAYCPYSNFAVGAAVVCVEDDKIFTGCNVENAVYPIGICAERTAISKAVSEGYRRFSAVIITSEMSDTFITPCGACRQFIAEFGMDWDVYMTKPDKSFIKLKIRELLPLGFGPSELEETKTSELKVKMASLAVSNGHSN